MLPPSSDHVVAHLSSWLIGMLIGIGQLLATGDEVSTRRLLGQALVSGGLGASSGALLLLIPDAPILAVLGVSAALSSVGVTLLERLVLRFTGGGKENA